MSLNSCHSARYGPQLTGNKMNAGREIINTSLLPTQVEDADLRIGHTTVEAGFGIWLVLAVAVTSCWTTGHLV